MRSIFLLLGFFILAWSCKKLEDQLHSGYLAGKLVAFNPQEPSSPATPLANAKIKIATSPSDLLNYQRSVTTNAEGYFICEQLEKGEEYTVFYRDSLNHVAYSDSASVSTNRDDISLIAQPDLTGQTSLVISVTDPAGDPVGSVSVCIFNNETAWKADTCLGSLRSVVLKEDGTAVLYNLTAGKYFLYVSAVLKQQFYRGRVEVEIQPSGESAAGIQLQPVTDKNSLEVKVIDAQGDPADSVDVCVFNNAMAWNTNDCAGSIYTIKTDAQGKVKKPNVPPGNHYLLASAIINQQMYRAKAPLLINETGPNTITLQLATVPDTTTGFEISVVDGSGSPVNGAEVCVFINKTLYLADTCIGNIYELTTNEVGKASKTHIAPGTYYMRVYLKVGEVVFKALDELAVLPNEMKKKTITIQ